LRLSHYTVPVARRWPHRSLTLAHVAASGLGLAKYAPPGENPPAGHVGDTPPKASGGRVSPLGHSGGPRNRL
jgi:hypothetical protein